MEEILAKEEEHADDLATLLDSLDPREPTGRSPQALIRSRHPREQALESRQRAQRVHAGSFSSQRRSPARAAKACSSVSRRALQLPRARQPASDVVERGEVVGLQLKARSSISIRAPELPEVTSQVRPCKGARTSSGWT